MASSTLRPPASAATSAFVARVEEGAELLALRLAHVVAHERLAGALVHAPGEDLGLDPHALERPTHVAAGRGVAERRDHGLRADDDEARGAGHEEERVVGAVRQVGDHVLAARADLRERLAERRGDGRPGGHALEVDEEPLHRAIRGERAAELPDPERC